MSCCLPCWKKPKKYKLDANVAGLENPEVGEITKDELPSNNITLVQSNGRTTNNNGNVSSLPDEVIEQLEAEKTKIENEKIRLENLAKQLRKKEADLELQLTKRTTNIEPPQPDVGFVRKRENQRSQRRRGIRAAGETVVVQAKKYPKTPEQRKFLRDAILENEFLHKMVKNESQMNRMIDYMRRTIISEKRVIIKEGSKGNELYILERGRLIVSKEGKNIAAIDPGSVFGELSLLYESERTATVTSRTVNTYLWALEGQVFRVVMTDAAVIERKKMIQMLRKVPLFQKMDQKHIGKMSDAVEKCNFEEDEYVVRQGELGETFYILVEGSVKVTETHEGIEEERRTLLPGDCFGEGALLSDDGARTANVVTRSPVTCLTLDKKAFTKLVGRYADRRWSSLAAEEKVLDLVPKKMSTSLAGCSLVDLEDLGTLGEGGFGRVGLVRMKNDPSRTFALKCLKKTHVLETGQEERIFSEKIIMRDANSPFLVRLYRTFKDDSYVYMLMEACLGGELWSKLRDDGSFTENQTRFYAACVVEALDYLHKRGIIYRDLKPENLLLDNQGYLKLVDFGFAKTIGFGEKTWTFCGTPEYVAPEVILCQGHDLAVDYWALGVLIYELLTGRSPFENQVKGKTHRSILRGIDAIKWPFKIQAACKNLIRRLCRENPADRLGNLKDGISQIRTHKWFSGFQWESLQGRKLEAPHVPQINGPCDLSNFDEFPPHKYSAKPEFSGWDENF